MAPMWREQPRSGGCGGRTLHCIVQCRHRATNSSPSAEGYAPHLREGNAASAWRPCWQHRASPSPPRRVCRQSIRLSPPPQSSAASPHARRRQHRVSHWPRGPRGHRVPPSRSTNLGSSHPI